LAACSDTQLNPQTQQEIGNSNIKFVGIFYYTLGTINLLCS